MTINLTLYTGFGNGEVEFGESWVAKKSNLSVICPEFGI